MLRLIMSAQTSLSNLRDDLKGVTAMEYGLIAATMVIIVGASIAVVGTDLTTLFGKIGTALTAAGG